MKDQVQDNMQKSLYRMIYSYMLLFGFDQTSKDMARLMGQAKDEIDQRPMV